MVLGGRISFSRESIWFLDWSAGNRSIISAIVSMVPLHGFKMMEDLGKSHRFRKSPRSRRPRPSLHIDDMPTQNASFLSSQETSSAVQEASYSKLDLYVVNHISYEDDHHL